MENQPPPFHRNPHRRKANDESNREIVRNVAVRVQRPPISTPCFPDTVSRNPLLQPQSPHLTKPSDSQLRVPSWTTSLLLKPQKISKLPTWFSPFTDTFAVVEGLDNPGGGPESPGGGPVGWDGIVPSRKIETGKGWWDDGRLEKMKGYCSWSCEFGKVNPKPRQPPWMALIHSCQLYLTAVVRRVKGNSLETPKSFSPNSVKVHFAPRHDRVLQIRQNCNLKCASPMFPILMMERPREDSGEASPGSHLKPKLPKKSRKPRTQMNVQKKKPVRQSS